MFFTAMCPSGGTKYVSLELLLGILTGPGKGRGGDPGTVPLQNPKVNSRKACLRDAALICGWFMASSVPFFRSGINAVRGNFVLETCPLAKVSANKW